MKIISWLLGILVRPTGTLMEMENDESWAPALIVHAVVIELFEVVFIISILMQRVPNVRLVLPIGPDHYYLAQVFYGPVVYVGGVALLLFLAMVLGREADGEGEWKSLFTKLSFSVAVPLLFLLWPVDLVLTILNLGYGNFGTLGRYALMGLVGLALLWCSYLCVLSISMDHRLPPAKAVMIYIPAVTPSLVAFVAAFR